MAAKSPTTINQMNVTYKRTSCSLKTANIAQLIMRTIQGISMDIGFAHVEKKTTGETTPARLLCCVSMGDFYLIFVLKST